MDRQTWLEFAFFTCAAVQCRALASKILNTPSSNMTSPQRASGHGIECTLTNNNVRLVTLSTVYSESVTSATRKWTLVQWLAARSAASLLLHQQQWRQCRSEASDDAVACTSLDVSQLPAVCCAVQATYTRYSRLCNRLYNRLDEVFWNIHIHNLISTDLSAKVLFR